MGKRGETEKKKINMKKHYPGLAVRSWGSFSASPAPVKSEVLPFPFLRVPAVNSTLRKRMNDKVRGLD